MSKLISIIAHSRHLNYSESEVITVTFNDFPYRCIQELATHRTCNPMAITDARDENLFSINPFTNDISRNSESSRAVPTPKLIERIKNDPYIPQWRSAQKGMQGGDALPVKTRTDMTEAWLQHRDAAIELALAYHDFGLCKQDISAILLPFMKIDIIATGSKKAWDNFIKLRAHPDAHPDFAAFAHELADCIMGSKPNILEPGDWHIPYKAEAIAKGLTAVKDILDYSVVKCARFSYKGSLGNIDPETVRVKAATLQKDGHMSPFEHQVRCVAHQMNYHYKTLQKGWVNRRTWAEDLGYTT